MGRDIYSFLPPWRSESRPENWPEIEVALIQNHGLFQVPKGRAWLPLSSAKILLLVNIISCFSAGPNPAYPLFRALSLASEDVLMLPEQVRAWADELADFESCVPQYQFFDIMCPARFEQITSGECDFDIIHPWPLRADLWRGWIGCDGETAWCLATDGKEIFLLRKPWPHLLPVDSSVTPGWPDDGSQPELVARFRKLLVNEVGSLVDADTGAETVIPRIAECSSATASRAGPTHRGSLEIVNGTHTSGVLRPYAFPLSMLLRESLPAFSRFVRAAAAANHVVWIH